MTRYRPWVVAKWDREPFRSLSPTQRYVYLTIYLGPYSTALPGVSTCGPAALAEAAGLPDFDVQMAELRQRGVLLSDVVARIFFLPDAINDAPPANPNAVKAWRSAFDELNDCDVKRQIDQHVRCFLLAYGASNPAKPSHLSPASPFTWILTWDPMFKEDSTDGPDTLSERSINVHRTLPQHSTDVSQTLAEPETGSEPGMGPGAEPATKATTEKGAARKGEQERVAGETIGENQDRPNRFQRNRRGREFEALKTVISDVEFQQRLATFRNQVGDK